MTDWIIKEKVSAIVPSQIKEKLEKAVHDADTLGELFLGVLEIEDDEEEFVLIKKKDFEDWYGRV